MTMPKKTNGEPFTVSDLPMCKGLLDALRCQHEALEAELMKAIAVAQEGNTNLDTLRAEHAKINGQFMELSREFRKAKEAYSEAQATLKKARDNVDGLQAQVSIMAEQEASIAARILKTESAQTTKRTTPIVRDTDDIRSDMAALMARIKVGQTIVDMLEGMASERTDQGD